MALTRLNEFDAGTSLTETEIEGEFDNIYANSLSLISPLTGNLAVGGFRLTGFGLGTVGDPSIQFTGDTNTGIYSTAADTVDISTGGVRAASFGATALVAAVPEDSRTATVDQAFEIRSTTSGSPAAGIGVGLLFSAESADENPSDFGRVDFAATDIGAGTEDTYLSILLRVAGRALDEKYRFSSTAGDGFAALFTHAVTADRTYTLPDASANLGVTRSTQNVATGETTTSVTYTDLATSGPAVTITPTNAVATDQIILYSATMDTSSAGNRSFMSPAIAGAAASDIDAQINTSGGASQPYRNSAHALPTAVASGSTHTAKYRVTAGTGTFADRRISAFTLN